MAILGTFVSFIVAIGLSGVAVTGCCTDNSSYCGSSLPTPCVNDGVANYDSDVLYSCAIGQRPVLVRQCIEGCKTTKLENDHCNNGNATNTESAGTARRGNPLNRNLNWMVSVQLQGHDGYPRHVCTGALITNQLIVAAAHCFFYPQPDLLTDDSAILVKTSQADNTEALRVAQVIVHPRYNNTRMSTYLQHDIAVLRLQRPIVQSIIELPKSSFTALSLETVASVAGYGLIARTGEPLRYDLLSEIPHKLQETRVKVMDTTQCRARWPAMTMTNGMFCTYRSLNDVCVGPGSAIIFEDYWNGAEERFQRLLIGILAGRASCTRANSANVVTKVAAYVDEFLQPIIDNATGRAKSTTPAGHLNYDVLNNV